MRLFRSRGGTPQDDAGSPGGGVEYLLDEAPHGCEVTLGTPQDDAGSLGGGVEYLLDEVPHGCEVALGGCCYRGMCTALLAQ